MLVDGLVLTSTSEIQNVHVESGTSFPITTTQGRAFYLTAINGAYSVGFYVYDGYNWVTGDITAVTAGTGLVGGGTGGNITLSVDTNIVYKSSPYDIAGSILGKPAAAAVVMRLVAVRNFQFAANFTTSLAKAATSSTAAASFSIQKNGAQFGTMSFAAGGTTGTFTSTLTSFAAGDVLTVVAPSTADATLGDIEYMLVGTLL
jgi:hypothetical protein